MNQKRTLRRVAMGTGVSLVAGIALSATMGLPAFAGGGHGGPDRWGSKFTLSKAVKGDNVAKHLDRLQEIADANDGNRAAGTTGHVAAAEYIEGQLTKAGYTPVRQPFSYDQFVENSASFSQVSPTATDYLADTDFAVMSYSGAGDVTGVATPVDLALDGDRASTSGCEVEDFAGFAAGTVALIQRGTCSFRIKADNAIAAGASAVVIFNQGNGDDRMGVINGTLDAPQVSVPVVGASFAVGESLAATESTVQIAVDATVQTVETFNILADSAGAEESTVVVGAHLDSVHEGPGINDNGSGSAAILETAIQLSKLKVTPTNKVRFAFWSGEEDGLVGSDHYVAQLTDAEIQNHAANLNFDMVGSPNGARFVYDGDGSSFGLVGPEGSAEIEAVFNDYFAEQGLAAAPTEFSGRSDYSAFIDAGIPAGGLFSGAEGIKTEEEAVTFGGTAGEAYDACYHSACDTVENIDPTLLDQMSDAVAHATQVYAATKWQHKWHGSKGHGKGHFDKRQEWKGSHFNK